MSSQPLSTVKRDFCFGEFQANSMFLLNPEHSILTDVKTNRNEFKSSGQDILAWRVQLFEVEPFNGFSVSCELWHFRFSGYFLVVACRPLFFGISEYLQKIWVPTLDCPTWRFSP